MPFFAPFSVIFQNCYCATALLRLLRLLFFGGEIGVLVLGAG